MASLLACDVPRERGLVSETNFSSRADLLLPTPTNIACDEGQECGESHLAQSGLVALSITWREGVFLYGHVWPTLFAFWRAFVAPRMTVNDPPRWLRTQRLAIPSGVNIRSVSGGLFNDIATIFSGSAQLEIQRADWVPLCWRGCCWSRGSPPTQPVALLSGFPSLRQFNIMENPGGSANSRFQANARHALGVTRASMTSSDYRRGGTVLWVPTKSKHFGYGQVSILNETRLTAAAADWLATRKPSGPARRGAPEWKLVVLDFDESYKERLQAFANAAVVVALFGSALQNCRFMTRGAVVVEIHGGLRGNFDEDRDHFYERMCAQEGLGLRWVGYVPPGFRPVRTTTLPGRDRSHSSEWEHEIIDGASTYDTAHVEVAPFLHLLEGVLERDWDRLAQAYENETRSHPDPRRQENTFHERKTL